jgi:uncharacterized membrane protein YkvA (DUF1232 family)
VRGIILSLVAIAGAWLLMLVALAVAGRKTAARELARLLPDLILLVHGLLRDPRVPRARKVYLLIATAWVASPIDLIPEFVPVVGPLDDVIVVAFVVRSVARSTDRAVIADHWRGSPSMLAKLLGHNTR